MDEQLELFDSGWCQRWRHRNASWRHTDEGGFDPGRYLVAPVREGAARQFVETHHYSRSWPSARLRYGMHDLTTLRLVGVAVLGVPMSKRVLTKPFPTLEPYRESLELSRLVLLDEVPANAESWFITRVFRNAAEDGLRGVVAFSDPMPRRHVAGLVMPGHVGIVYQACNAWYTGRGTKRSIVVLPDGTVLSARSIAKVTGGERGAAGVLARLAGLGAPAGAPLLEQLAAISARRVRHGGNHRFCFQLGTRSQRRAAPIAMPALLYPKAVDPYISGALITV